MKEAVIILLIIHGIMHLFGYSKAYQVPEMDQFSQNITRFEGIFWLLATILFLVSGIGYLLGLNWWIVIALISLLLSQFLIVKHWFDARMGTIMNVIIIIAIFANFSVK